MYAKNRLRRCCVFHRRVVQPKNVAGQEQQTGKFTDLTLGVFLLNFCLVIHSDGDFSHLLLVRATSVDTAMPFSLIRSAREVGKVSSNLVFIALKEFFGHRINMYPFNRTDQVI